MSLADRVDDIPDGLPPSALYVLRVLVDADSWMMFDDLLHETLLAQSTVHYALDRLEAEGLVDRRPGSDNPGKREYRSTICSNI